MPAPAPVTQIVLVGCGAMAIETAVYIHDMERAARHGTRLRITDVVANEWSRRGDMESTVGYGIAFHDRIESVTIPAEKAFVIAIGDTAAVHRISREITALDLRFFNVIHPTAMIAKGAVLGAGLIVAPFAYVGPFASVGDNSILNVRSTTGHDVRMGTGCIVSPHADINGRAKLGKGVFVGAGAIVDPDVAIGDFCKLASGVTVRKDLPAGHLAFDADTKSVRMFHPETGAKLFGPR